MAMATMGSPGMGGLVGMGAFMPGILFGMESNHGYGAYSRMAGGGGETGGTTTWGEAAGMASQADAVLDSFLN